MEKPKINILKVLIRNGAILATAAFLLSFILAAVFKSYNHNFWGDFFLNVAAEMLGLAVAVWAAYVVSRRNSDDLISRAINLIALLRRSNHISPDAARAGVIFAVAVIPDDRLRRTDPPLSILRRQAHCQVCSLTAETEPGEGSLVKCHHCGLHSDKWRNPDGG